MKRTHHSSTLDDLLPLLGRYIVCHLSAVCPVVHQQEIEICYIVDDSLEEACKGRGKMRLPGTSSKGVISS